MFKQSNNIVETHQPNINEKQLHEMEEYQSAQRRT